MFSNLILSLEQKKMFIMRLISKNLLCFDHIPQQKTIGLKQVKVQMYFQLIVVINDLFIQTMLQIHWQSNYNFSISRKQYIISNGLDLYKRDSRTPFHSFVKLSTIMFFKSTLVKSFLRKKNRHYHNLNKVINEQTLQILQFLNKILLI